MEVISVIGLAGSVLGIVDVVTKSISTLKKLQQQWQSADWTINSLLGHLTTLKLALTQLTEWFSLDLAADSQHQLLADDLCTSLDCCRTLISSLDSHISQLERNEDKALTFESKMKVVLNDSYVKDCVAHLNNQSTALSLFFNVLSW